MAREADGHGLLQAGSKSSEGSAGVISVSVGEGASGGGFPRRHRARDGEAAACRAEGVAVGSQLTARCILNELQTAYSKRCKMQNDPR